MRFEKERAKLADIGREFLGTGMTVATGGNISIRIPGEGVMIITPSGMDYRTLTGEDMCILEVQTGKQVEGARTPSSESPMHLAVYRGRHDFNAVAHTHTPYCTAFSMIRESIPLVHYLVPVLGGSIPVAEYATYGTEAMGPAAGKPGHPSGGRSRESEGAIREVRTAEDVTAEITCPTSGTP